ncbi:MAG: TetR/AcrR family transcriptional regulator [Bacteroidota bacterium]
MEAKLKILAGAEALFLQYGIRSITMDDVARQCAASKKTLYQYFENKDALVLEVAAAHFERERAEFLKIEEEAEDAVHQLILVSQCLRNHMHKMNPSVLFDMQKYHSSSWQEYLQFKHEVIRGHIQANIERGKKEGLFKAELDAEMLSIMRVEQVQMVFNTSIFPADKFDFREVQMQIMDHFINGLLTEKGRRQYDAYTEKVRGDLQIMQQ